MANEKDTTIDIAAADDSLNFLQQQNIQGNDDNPIDEKALVRRIDYRIVPLMFCCYLVGFLDKVLINVSIRSPLPT